jgi:starch synthase
MYSLRYGTIPVVFATGGLDDTVEDADVSPRRGTGFKFDRFTAAGLVEGVERALTAYQERVRWRQIQRRAMACDFSWDVSAREYVKVYREAAKTPHGIR